MGLEKAIEDVVKEKAEAAGWLVRKLQWQGRRGAFDRLFIKEGRIVFVELKSPRQGAKLSAIQSDELALFQAAGAECHVLDTPTSILAVLGVEW